MQKEVINISDFNLNSFIKDKICSYPTAKLDQSIYVFKRDQGEFTWERLQDDEGSQHPGILFYSKPPLIVERDHIPGVNSMDGDDLPSFFTSNKKELNGELKNLQLEQKSYFLQPLFLPENNVTRASRVFVDSLAKDSFDTGFLSMKFKELTLNNIQTLIFEPTFVSVFLYSKEYKKKVSQSWRMLFYNHSSGSRIDIGEFVQGYVLNSPKEVMFPIPPNSNFVVIITLERLFLKDGGKNSEKYLNSPTTESERRNINEDLHQFFRESQPLPGEKEKLKTSSMFAWSYKTMNELKNQKKVVFNKFYGKTSLSDSFLNEFFKNNVSLKEKPYKLSVVFDVSLVDPLERVAFLNSTNLPRKLITFFPNSLYKPSLNYENTLIIQIQKILMNPPRGVKSFRNIVLVTKLYLKGKIHKLNEYDELHFSKSQYHVENPDIYDDIYVRLPPDMDESAHLLVDIFQISAKSKAVYHLASSKIHLFVKKGVFLQNGKHTSSIVYQDKPSDTESNKIIFDTYLFSTVYSTDQCVSRVLDCKPLTNEMLVGYEHSDATLLISDRKRVHSDSQSLSGSGSSSQKRSRSRKESPSNTAASSGKIIKKKSVLNLLPFFGKGDYHDAKNRSKDRQNAVKTNPLDRANYDDTDVRPQPKRHKSVKSKKIPPPVMNLKPFHVGLDLKEVTIKLFPVLDNLILQVAMSQYNSFVFLVDILFEGYTEKCFSSSYDEINRHLEFYIKNAALHNVPDKLMEKFVDSIVSLWIRYYDNNEMLEYSKDTKVAWFLFDIIIKCIVIVGEDFNRHELVKLLQRLQLLVVKKSDINSSHRRFLNVSLTHFYTDLVEVLQKKAFIFREVIVSHIEIFNLKKEYHILRFKEYILNLLTPKIFIMMLLPIATDGTNYFQRFILPFIERNIRNYDVTNYFFNVFHNLFRVFTENEQNLFAPSLTCIIDMIGSNFETIDSYQDLRCYLYMFSVTHFIICKTVGSNMTVLPDMLALTCRLMVSKVRHFSVDEIKYLIENNVSNYNILKELNIGKRSRRQSRARESCTGERMSELYDVQKQFDKLAFCIQCSLIKLIQCCDGVNVVNHLLCPMFDVEVSPYLVDDFLNAAQTFADREPVSLFGYETSNIKHIIRKVMGNPSREGINLITAIASSEISHHRSTRTTLSLFARALSKERLTKSAFELIQESFDASSEFYMLSHRIYTLTNEMERLDDKVYPEIKAGLLYELAEAYRPSPDARVDALLSLAKFQAENNYLSESVIATINAASLVIEHMIFLDRDGVYSKVFKTNHPVELFTEISPAAELERISADDMRYITRVFGFCTSNWFTENGFFEIIKTIIMRCKVAQLYEVLSKLYNIILPLARYRHLWGFISNYFYDCEYFSQAANTLYTFSDRSLGVYYKVQFHDEYVFIYRNSKNQNLWQFCEAIKPTAQYYARDKEVSIVQQGNGLTIDQLEDPDKYYVHVKYLLQYFTPEERKARSSVFEQNFNIGYFYYDIPFSKNAQTSIEHCWLKRTIIELDYPMPFLLSRVRVSERNFKYITFQPIQYACQSMRDQIAKIEESCQRLRILRGMKNHLGEREGMNDLQMRLQGTLLTSVNEGPLSMAEKFLGKSGYDERNLREIFKEFIVVIEEAVHEHGFYAHMHQDFAVFQEQFEMGLQKMIAELQGYLK